MVRQLFWAAALAASAVNAADVLHERRTTPVSPRAVRVDPDAIIPIRIGLRQQNLDVAEERLMEVSHPSSHKYGQHLSAEEVHKMFAPATETIETVKNWLIESGIDASEILPYRNKGWLGIDLPAKHAERLFSTEYYEHELGESTRIGCDAYYLPEHVSKHVDFIKPGVALSAPLKKRSIQKRSSWPHGGGRGGGWPGPGSPSPPHLPPNPFPSWSPPWGAGSLPSELQNCAVNITPPCIQALYHLPLPHTVPTSPLNVMGLYESYDTFAVADIELFFKNFAPWVPQGTVPSVISVDGGNAPVAASDPRNGGESDIDIDLAQSLIYPQTITVYQVDDLPNSSGETNTTGFLNTFLDSVDGSYCNYTAYGITGNSPGMALKKCVDHISEY